VNRISQLRKGNLVAKYGDIMPHIGVAVKTHDRAVGAAGVIKCVQRNPNGRTARSAVRAAFGGAKDTAMRMP
jgi:hypothetical protein